MREKIKALYLDKAIGIIFVTEEGREYAYKYFNDASGAIADVQLVELPKKNKPKPEV